MIEILILYVLSKKDRTIYSIRKDIINFFGAFARPSIGTIAPALKRLEAENAVSRSEKISEGGRKSCFYSISSKGLSVFKKYFFDSKKNNPSLFYADINARLGTIGLLKPQERKLFIEQSLRSIDIMIFEIQKQLEDEFLPLDAFQTKLLNRIMTELKSLKNYMQNLGIENAL